MAKSKSNAPKINPKTQNLDQYLKDEKEKIKSEMEDDGNWQVNSEYHSMIHFSRKEGMFYALHD